MKHLFSSLLVLGLCVPATAQVVLPAGAEAVTDPEIKNLQWNRYVTPNFVIMSIDDAQGKWLAANIEGIKSWCLKRWGLPDVSFGTINVEGRAEPRCRVMCVPNRRLLKKLFNLTEFRWESRRVNEGGRLELTALWLVLDDKPARTVPVALSHACFAEFQDRHGPLCWAACHGMALLNATPAEIIQQLQQARPTSCQNLLSLSGENYAKLTTAEKKVVDAELTALVLFLRKEFGESRLHRLLRQPAPSSGVIRAVYGFQDYAELDRSFHRYVGDLANELSARRVPPSYLDIKAKK